MTAFDRDQGPWSTDDPTKSETGQVFKGTISVHPSVGPIVNLHDWPNTWILSGRHAGAVYEAARRFIAERLGVASHHVALELVEREPLRNRE